MDALDWAHDPPPESRMFPGPDAPDPDDFTETPLECARRNWTECQTRLAAVETMLHELHGQGGCSIEDSLGIIKKMVCSHTQLADRLLTLDKEKF